MLLPCDAHATRSTRRPRVGKRSEWSGRARGGVDRVGERYLASCAGRGDVCSDRRQGEETGDERGSTIGERVTQSECAMSAQSSRSALRWRSVEVDARRGAAMRLRPAPGRARARESTRELSQAKREVESSEASGRVGSASASSLPVLDSATCPWVPGGAWRRATTADRRTDCARRERCAMSAQSDRGAHRRWTVGSAQRAFGVRCAREPLAAR